MKRSEMLRILGDYLGYEEHHPTMTGIITSMEKKGQPWDPEEPLPERLEVRGGMAVVPDPGSPARFRNLTRREHAEAVRRWNAWKRIRRLVAHAAWPPSTIKGALLAILDAEERE